MSRLAEDIDFLQRAADAAGLILYPGGNNDTFADAARVNVPADTLSAYAAELESRRLQPREYQLIDYEAVWLLRAAQQLLLHKADGESAKADRFQKLGEYLRSAIELDLANARKSLAVPGMIQGCPCPSCSNEESAPSGRSPAGSGGDREASVSPPAAESLQDVNPWHPISDAIDLKHLGKFGEELNECGAAVSRCIIQGVDECEPVTGKSNREWLEDEVADVRANAERVIERFGLDEARIAARADKKKLLLARWHALP